MLYEKLRFTLIKNKKKRDIGNNADLNVIIYNSIYLEIMVRIIKAIITDNDTDDKETKIRSDNIAIILSCLFIMDSLPRRILL